MKKKIGVIFGGKSSEHEVSIESAKTVCAKLGKAGFSVLPFYAPRAGAWRLVKVKDLLSGGRLAGPEIEPSLGGGCFTRKGGGRLRPDALFPIIDKEEAARSFAELPADVQTEAFDILVAAACADGRVVDEERSFLAAIGEVIGIDFDELSARLKAALASRD
jgi:D-alanine-D-alanine ligase-like ATP-grasp enzyme